MLLKINSGIQVFNKETSLSYEQRLSPLHPVNWLCDVYVVVANQGLSAVLPKGIYFSD